MATPVPYEVIPIKSREDWLDTRNTGIGGSDAAAVVGVSQFKSPLKLWMEKTGAVEPDDLSEQKNVKWGNLIEPILASEYARLHPGVKVKRKNAVLRSKDHPFMLATLDRTVMCPERGRGGWEGKTTGWFAGQSWGDESDPSSVPDAYQLQVQHYMAVTGWDFFDVSGLIGGQDDRHYTILRDQDVIDALVEAEGRFWQMVQDCVMPDLTGAADESSALLALFPKASEEVLDLSTATAIQLAEQHVAAKRTIEQADAIRKKCASELKALMGDHSKATAGAATITWSKFTKKKVDLAAITAQAPDLVAAATTEVPSDRFVVTPPKASK